MTREEAIKVIEGRYEIMDYCESARLEEALDIAIESLKQKEIITCKDCKFSHLTSNGECEWCEKWVDAGDLMIELYVSGDFYCGYAIRREATFEEYISELKKVIQEALDVIGEGLLKIKEAVDDMEEGEGQ